MYEERLQDEPAEQINIFKPANDTFLAGVPWTKNRTVVVFRRERNGREYVRCRTFNRHQLKKVWYSSPRFYMVPVDCAEELRKAIIAAARGEKYGQPPGWWYDFLKQYEAGEWRTKPEDEMPEGGYCHPLYDAESGSPRPSRSPRRLPGLPRLPSLPRR